MRGLHQVLEVFDGLSLWPIDGSSPAWAPPLTPGRNLRRLAQISPGYSPPVLAALLRTIEEAGISRRQIVLSNFADGLPAIFWANVFGRVVAIAQSRDRSYRFDEHGSVLVGFGGVDNTRFLYDLAARCDAPAALLLDEDRYSKFISPYYLLKKRLEKPALCIFLNRASDTQERQAAATFVEHLRSGFLDGTKHQIRRVDDGIPDSSACVERIG